MTIVSVFTVLPSDTDRKWAQDDVTVRGFMIEQLQSFPRWLYQTVLNPKSSLRDSSRIRGHSSVSLQNCVAKLFSWKRCNFFFFFTLLVFFVINIIVIISLYKVLKKWNKKWWNKQIIVICKCVYIMTAACEAYCSFWHTSLTGVSLTDISDTPVI